MITRSLLVTVGILNFAGLAVIHADVRLPSIFGDHMVLQQDATLPVWGWADPGEKITISFGAAKAETIAGTDGKWRASLPPVPAGTPPGSLVVTGKNTLTIKDALVGDVWICSGQSNMAWGLNGTAAGKLAKAAEGKIRLFRVTRKVGLAPREDTEGTWKVCEPGSATGFSAVGGLFGGNLLAVLNRPIGLIDSTWGGTRAQAWTSLAGFQRDPALAHHAMIYENAAANYPGGPAQFDSLAIAQESAMKAWAEGLQTNTEYQAALKAWKTASEVALAAKQPAPPRPAFPSARPDGLKVSSDTPTALFNGMIHPLVPFAIKGVIWYQGESNTSAALEYQKLFPALISDWRAQWKQGDFPFLFVQLPNFRAPPKTAEDPSTWALLRDSQLKTLSLPKTGMAVTIDSGDAKNLHPGNKPVVAIRLALVARHVAYGEDLVYTGPLYEAMKPESGQIRITFKADTLGGGLVIGSAPKPDGKATTTTDTVVRGFVIAGKDQKWTWADAKIEGASVIVSNPQVPEPVAVRYAWADNPVCNLYNKEGLPASPFRTDDWNPKPVTATSSREESAAE